MSLSRRFTSFGILALLLLAIVSTATGCGKKRRMQADPTFSINVFAPPADWPDEKKDWQKMDPRMAEVMQAVYEKHGAPDFFRVLWNSEGRIMSQTEYKATMWATRNNKNKGPAPELEWVYLGDGITYQFKNRVPVRRELKDNIRIICEYGDPMEVKETRDITGAPQTTYHYFDRGKIFYFREGKKVNEQDVTAMPGMGMRR